MPEDLIKDDKIMDIVEIFRPDTLQEQCNVNTKKVQFEGSNKKNLFLTAVSGIKAVFKIAQPYEEKRDLEKLEIDEQCYIS